MAKERLPSIVLQTEQGVLIALKVDKFLGLMHLGVIVHLGINEFFFGWLSFAIELRSILLINSLIVMMIFSHSEYILHNVLELSLSSIFYWLVLKVLQFFIQDL